jgi:predicted membrane channel-forming protein YqfA (hemolysin III family)
MSELFPFLLGAWVVCAWFTHVITCLKTASWGFLIAGAVFFPVGCVHGTGIWFGWF